MLPGFPIMLPGAAVISAVLTAAVDPNDPANIGFFNGALIGADPSNDYGSLTGEPLAGENCFLLNYNSDIIAAVVVGDVSGLVATMSFYFNDVEFPITYVQYDILIGDYTYFRTASGVLTAPFVVGVPINVRIE